MQKELLQEFLDVLKKEDIFNAYSRVFNTYLDLEEILLSEEKVKALLSLNNKIELLLHLNMYLTKREIPLEYYNVFKEISVLGVLACCINTFESNLFKDDGKLSKLEIIKILASVKENHQATYAYKTARNRDIQKRDDALEIINLIVKAEQLFQTEYACRTATDYNISKRDDALEIIKLIVNTKSYHQAHYGYETAVDRGVQKRADALEIIKLIVNAKGDGQAEYGYFTAIESSVQEREDALKIIKLVVTVKEEHHARCAYRTLLDCFFQGRKNIYELKQAIIDNVTGEEYQYSYSRTNDEPEYLECEFSECLKNNNVDYLLEVLNDVPKDLDITPKTKVRIKNGK